MEAHELISKWNSLISEGGSITINDILKSVISIWVEKGNERMAYSRGQSTPDAFTLEYSSYDKQKIRCFINNQFYRLDYSEEELKALALLQNN